MANYGANTPATFNITSGAWTASTDTRPVMLTGWAGDGIYIATSITSDLNGASTTPVTPTIVPADTMFDNEGCWISEDGTLIIRRLRAKRRCYYPLYNLIGSNFNGIWYRSIGATQSITITDDKDNATSKVYLFSTTTNLLVPNDQWIDIGSCCHIEVADNAGAIEVWQGDLLNDGPAPTAAGRVLHGYRDGGYDFPQHSLIWGRAIGKPTTVVLDAL